MLTVRQGIGAVALKGAWAAAKLGRNVIGYYKKLFVEAPGEFKVSSAEYMLDELAKLNRRYQRAPVDGAHERTHDAAEAVKCGLRRAPSGAGVVHSGPWMARGGESAMDGWPSRWTTPASGGDPATKRGNTSETKTRRATARG